mmetsp:Transcript_15128/g.42651  ORF Transcript_15128/g.42651 Transcript_15128/m.42651 type:complete len:354 (-) Transcript_15128:435-1496(-)
MLSWTGRGMRVHLLRLRVRCDAGACLRLLLLGRRWRWCCHRNTANRLSCDQLACRTLAEAILGACRGLLAVGSAQIQHVALRLGCRDSSELDRSSLVAAAAARSECILQPILLVGDGQAGCSIIEHDFAACIIVVSCLVVVVMMTASEQGCGRCSDLALGVPLGRLRHGTQSELVDVAILLPEGLLQPVLLAGDGATGDLGLLDNDALQVLLELAGLRDDVATAAHMAHLLRGRWIVGQPRGELGDGGVSRVGRLDLLLLDLGLDAKWGEVLLGRRLGAAAVDHALHEGGRRGGEGLLLAGWWSLAELQLIVSVATLMVLLRCSEHCRRRSRTAVLVPTSRRTSELLWRPAHL